MTDIDVPAWVRDAIFYEIFPDRFARSDRVPKSSLNLESWESPPSPQGFKGGDLYGISDRLDYLEALGVSAVYLTPVFASASNHRYHTYDYYRVDPLLGGNEALLELIESLHRKGMRIILDGVFNHASRGFWQFHHVLETGRASPYKDWFHFDPERLDGHRHWGAYPSRQEQEAIPREGSFRALGYQAWWDLPALPKFNTANPEVKEFLFAVAEYWIRLGIDGWRLDVPGEIDDDAFWREFRQRVRAINPEAYIVGELWHEAHRWLQGDQFDAVMNYQFAAACLSFIPGTHLDVEETTRSGGYRGQVWHVDASEFASRLDALLHAYDPRIVGAQLNVLDSHDTPRFLTCASGDEASLKLALLLLMTYPGAPCLFYGDEIGLAGRHDPDCRQAFNWDERTWNLGLLEWTKALIKTRRQHPALRSLAIEQVHAADGVVAFRRRSEAEVLLVALNTSDQTEEFEIGARAEGSGLPRLLVGDGHFELDSQLRVRIPGRAGFIAAL